MGKAEWRKRRRERDERLARALGEKYGKAKYVVHATLGCGCCSTIMHFKNDQSAKAAFRAAGLGIFTIIDDAGEEHRDVDTFYGFRVATEEEKRGLRYLADVASG